MKYRLISFIFCFLFLWPFHCLADENKNIANPLVFLTEPSLKFKPVVEGTVLFHDFILQNNGKETLLIESVKPDTWCITVSYPKQILPGSEEKISVEIKTIGDGGETLKAILKIRTNSKETPVLSADISGFIQQIADIVPERILLRGKSNEKIITSIIITQKNNFPFDIISISPKWGNENVTAKLQRDNNTKIKQWILTVENLKQEKGSYWDVIYLETNKKEHGGVIKIPVSGDIF